jgi:hypothetical protein
LTTGSICNVKSHASPAGNVAVLAESGTGARVGMPLADASEAGTANNPITAMRSATWRIVFLLSNRGNRVKNPFAPEPDARVGFPPLALLWLCSTLYL